MATDTVIANPVELQVRGCAVTLLTAHRLVNAGEWKTIIVVQPHYIVDQPVGCRVAARTVSTHGLLVYIAVAGNTIGGCF